MWGSDDFFLLSRLLCSMQVKMTSEGRASHYISLIAFTTFNGLGSDPFGIFDVDEFR